MQFPDKLNFLMQITQTSNKELAEELAVDRSLISLLRNGKRNLPRRRELPRKMALFFARRCTADFQRHALSEMLGQAALRSDMPPEVLAGHLETWLTGEPDIVGRMVDSMAPQPVLSAHRPVSPPSHPSAGGTVFFYGDADRRKAIRRVLEVLHTMDAPGSFLVASDDNIDWLLSDYALTNQMRSELLEILRRGFHFHQIMPAMNHTARYTEALQFWLPLYNTGQMHVHYYPRLRDNLYRHSTIVVPGRCVLFSSGIGMNGRDITLFSTDPELVQAHTEQFQEQLALCRPALKAHTDPLKALPRLLEILTAPGTTILSVNPLPISAAPRLLLERCIRDAGNPAWESVFRVYLQEIPRFEERLRQGTHIDMARLATPAEVRAGQVFVCSPGAAYPGHPRYTPETYVLHLKNILRLMDTYENYCFLPTRDSLPPEYNLFVNENGTALLTRTASPFLMLELLRPELVMACKEHLLRKAERTGYDGIQRTRVRMELNALIRELQD